MRMVQEWLREKEIDDLVNAYFYRFPIEFERKDNLDLTVREIRDLRHNRLRNYISRLRELQICDSKDGHVGILFAHRIIKDGIDDVDFDLVHYDEVLEHGTDASGYAYEFTSQSEIMGFLVAETPMTLRYIDDLLADVLSEASFFGYEQEYLEENKQMLHERTQSVKDGTAKLIPWEKVKADLQEKYGLDLDEESPDESELHHDVIKAEYEYLKHSREKELKQVIEQMSYDKMTACKRKRIDTF